MLVVKRKKGESILIGENVEIKVIGIENGAVKIAIDAPKDVTILRSELYEEVENENKNAVCADVSVLKQFKKE